MATGLGMMLFRWGRSLTMIFHYCQEQKWQFPIAKYADPSRNHAAMAQFTGRAKMPDQTEPVASPPSDWSKCTEIPMICAWII